MHTTIFPIILENSYMLSPRVKHFVFKSELQPSFTYLPGQFITIHFEVDGKTLRRSYSIANPPQGDNRIEFAAGFVEQGPGSDLLFNLQPGDTLNINGPFGRLILKDDDPVRYILVATSTGVTPYRAMQHELTRRLAQNPALQISLLLGVQGRAHALYHDEFMAWVANEPRVDFQVYYSRHDASVLHAHEHAGYVQEAFAKIKVNPTEDLIYLCGNPAMIDNAFAALKEHGFTTHHVIREKYISAGQRP